MQIRKPIPTYKSLCDLQLTIINAMSSHIENHNEMISTYLNTSDHTSDEMLLIVAMFRSLLRSLKLTTQFRALMNKSFTTDCPFVDLRFLRCLTLDALYDYNAPNHLNLKNYPHIVQLTIDIKIVIDLNNAL